MNSEGLLQKIYLRPAELVLAEQPTIVTTILGSCVAVTLFSPQLKIGAICHAVLPSGKIAGPGKYSDQSVRYMLKLFADLGVAPEDLEAKLFGGAELFLVTGTGRRQLSVGAQNIQTACATLQAEGLRPLCSDIGGQQGRKLVFFSHTGEVFRKWVKRDKLMG